MTTQYTEPDENETAVRAALLKLGARPAGYAPTDDPEQPVAPVTVQPPAPVAVAVPPMPEHPPTIPAQDPRRAGQSRLPHWGKEDKPPLATGTDDDQDEEPDDEADDQTEETSERTDRPRRPRLRRVSKEPAADQDEEPEEDDEEDDDEVRRVGEGRGRRLRLPAKRSSQRPRFSTPAFPREEKERKSLAQAWRETRPDTKFALYHLTGLAGGLLFGVVGYATDVTRSVAESPLPLRENPAAYFWGASAVLVLVVDRATRPWFWPLGWCTRGITASVLVGAVLHGNTVGEAIADLPTLLDQLSDQP